MKVFWDSYGIVRGPSGIFVHARELRKALSANGVEVEVLDPEGRQGFFQPIFARSKILCPLANFREFNRHSDNLPAIYHGLSNINLPVWGVGSDSSRVRFVVTVHDLIPLLAEHGDVSHALRVQMEFLLPRVLKRAAAIVVVSNWTGRTIASHYPWAAHKLHVIPNGFPAVLAEARTSKGAPAVVRAMTVGRSENYKRHDLFLRTVAAGRGRLHGTLVVPAIRQNLQPAIEDLERRGWLRVVVAPTSETLELLYQESNVYLQTSLMEGFCLPAAEAQANGIPVVFISGSGIDEVVCPATGVGLSRGATEDEWLAAALDVGCRGESQTTTTWARSQPGWNDSAIKLKTLYNSL